MIIKKKRTAKIITFSTYYILFYIFFARLLTEELVLLPRYMQLTDKPLILIFLIVILLKLPKFKYLNFHGHKKNIAGLLIMWMLSVLLNPASQFIMSLGTHFLLLFGPISWFIILSVYHITEEDIYKFIKIIILLIFLQVLVGILQIPEGLAHPDRLRGTFGLGYKQLVFYYLLLACMFYGWYSYKNKEGEKFKRWIFPITLNFLVVRMLVVYPAYFFSLIMVNIIAKRRKNIAIPALSITFLLVSVFLGWSYFKEVSGESYQLDRFEFTMVNLFDILPRTGIVRSFVGWLNMIIDHPFKLFTGTGPATFGSRAFTNIYMDANVETNVTAGFFSAGQTPGLAFQYLLPVRQSGLGSGTVTQTVNSYVGILGELGIMGAIFFFGIYLKVVRDFANILKNNFSSYLKGLAVGVIASILFLAQMSFFYDFFAVERINLGLWLLIALIYKLREIEKRKLLDEKNKNPLYTKHPGSISQTTV